MQKQKFECEFKAAKKEKDTNETNKISKYLSLNLKD